MLDHQFKQRKGEGKEKRKKSNSDRLAAGRSCGAEGCGAARLSVSLSHLVLGLDLEEDLLDLQRQGNSCTINTSSRRKSSESEWTGRRSRWSSSALGRAPSPSRCSVLPLASSSLTGPLVIYLREPSVSELVDVLGGERSGGRGGHGGGTGGCGMRRQTEQRERVRRGRRQRSIISRHSTTHAHTLVRAASSPPCAGRG